VVHRRPGRDALKLERHRITVDADDLAANAPMARVCVQLTKGKGARLAAPYATHTAIPLEFARWHAGSTICSRRKRSSRPTRRCRSAC
jgi:hypothetical protein